MTERTTQFDHVLFDDESAATAELPGAFSAALPRGLEIGRAFADIPTGAEVPYRIPGVPASSDGDQVHFVRANRGHDSPTTTRDEPRYASARPDPYQLICELSDDEAHPPAFGADRTVIMPPESIELGIVFDQFDDELARMAPRWMTHAPVTRITAMIRDMRAFMRILLDDVELAPVYTRSAETTLMVHDTYVRVISVAGILREGQDERWANRPDLESANAHAEAMLDAFTPFVGLADRAMRRICLERDTLEEALRWLARQLDEEAEERLHAAEVFVARATARIGRGVPTDN